jgi:hypothetical protein
MGASIKQLLKKQHRYKEILVVLFHIQSTGRVKSMRYLANPKGIYLYFFAIK